MPHHHDALLKECRLCPRGCGVNRQAGALGYCRAGVKARLFRYGPHFGEEPPISGVRGSGTLFFSHCTLRCIYCQNHPWSQGGVGDEYEVEGLREIFRQLAQQGCHNWNLVSPTPWLPQIEAALTPLLRAGISLPIVYNTSGFEVLETLERFSQLVDIALIDLRYASTATAFEGSDAHQYVAYARGAVKWFHERLGALQVDCDGVARRGVICRLLALPGRANEVINNLEWLAQSVGTAIHLSVMAQYTPVYQAKEHSGWARRITAQEYESITAAVERLGFESGWVQDFEGEASADLLGENMPAGKGAVGTEG